MMIKKWKGIVAIVLALGLFLWVRNFFVTWYPVDEDRWIITTEG